MVRVHKSQGNKAGCHMQQEKQCKRNKTGQNCAVEHQHQVLGTATKHERTQSSQLSMRRETVCRNTLV